MKICNRCKTVTNDSSKFCAKCGSVNFTHIDKTGNATKRVDSPENEQVKTRTKMIKKKQSVSVVEWLKLILFINIPIFNIAYIVYLLNLKKADTNKINFIKAYIITLVIWLQLALLISVIISIVV